MTRRKQGKFYDELPALIIKLCLLKRNFFMDNLCPPHPFKHSAYVTDYSKA